MPLSNGGVLDFALLNFSTWSNSAISLSIFVISSISDNSSADNFFSSSCSISLSKTCGETTIPFELATDKDPIRLLPEIEDFTTSTSNVSLII